MVISGLKPHKSKYEITEIGYRLGLRIGLKCSNLTNEIVKILGCHFSYTKALLQQSNFKKHISNIENILKVWRLRHLTLKGKISVFRFLAISKIILH